MNDSEEGERPATRAKYNDDDDYSMSSSSSNKADISYGTSAENNSNAQAVPTSYMSQYRNGTPTGTNIAQTPGMIMPAGMPLMGMMGQQMQHVPTTGPSLRGTPMGGAGMVTGNIQQPGAPMGKPQQASQGGGRPTSGRKGRGHRAGTEEDDRSHTPPGQLSKWMVVSI